MHLRRFLTIATLLLFVSLPHKASALGCCVALQDGKSDASASSDVKSCFPMMNIGDCNVYKTNNGTATVWREKACSSLDICASRAPQNCCKSSIGGVVTKCIPSTDQSSCNIFIQSVKAQVLREGSDPSGLQSRLTDGACTTQSDCKGKIYDENIYSNNDFGSPTLTEDTNFVPTFITPTLAVNIPEVNFSALKIQDAGSEKYIDIPYLAQYIQGIYIYVMGAVGILAIAMLIWGGTKWISAGGNSELVSSAKKNITNAIVGLVLAFGSYLILSTINPSLVNLSSLHINFVTRITEDLWLKDYGTGDPYLSTEAADRAGEIAYAESTYTAISSIPFDKSLGWAGNIKNYCKIKGYKEATTGEEKRKFLSIAVLGWAKICIQNHLCGYCQACYTDASGHITSNPSVNYAMQSFEDHQVDAGTPENVWAFDTTECIPAWNNRKNPGGAAAFAKMNQCKQPVQALYQKLVADNISKNNMFGGDCGSFRESVFACAGVARNKTPKTAAYDPSGKPVKGGTEYLSEKDIDRFKNDPNMIVSAHMDENILALAEQKGGIKFGDMVYICCGGTKDPYAAHWTLYTGGRDDVPFSFIEMGGGAGVDVPGYGHVSGVHTQPKGWTVQDYVNMKTRDGFDKHKGLVFVWRPYSD
jgi:hypothetical protein